MFSIKGPSAGDRSHKHTHNLTTDWPFKLIFNDISVYNCVFLDILHLVSVLFVPLPVYIPLNRNPFEVMVIDAFPLCWAAIRLSPHHAFSNIRPISDLRLCLLKVLYRVKLIIISVFQH